MSKDFFEGRTNESPIQDLKTFSQAIDTLLLKTDEPAVVFVFSRQTLRKLSEEIQERLADATSDLRSYHDQLNEGDTL